MKYGGWLAVMFFAGAISILLVLGFVLWLGKRSDERAERRLKHYRDRRGFE